MSWLADGIREWPVYRPELGEVVGVVCWNAKAVDSDELKSMLSTAEFWLGECGYSLCRLPGRTVRRRQATPFALWLSEQERPRGQKGKRQ